MERAAKTWSGDWWTVGGGGTAWEGIVYDPSLDLLYFGTGNATAWYRDLRGKAEGDNLYTASILAVRASTGELAWYFQTVPGDNWDFDATQPLMQADLTDRGPPAQGDHAGVEERLLLRARSQDGRVHLRRAVRERDHVGVRAGSEDRPAGRVAVRLRGTASRCIVSPDPGGAHNWNPMAFNPTTGLVYLPAKVGTHAVHAPDAKWKYNPKNANLGMRCALRRTADREAACRCRRRPASLLAWDPVKQQRGVARELPCGRRRRRARQPPANLVFQGRADGMFAAYRATDGKQLWKFDAGTGIMAPPVTYTVERRAIRLGDGRMGRSRRAIQCAESRQDEARIWPHADVCRRRNGDAQRSRVRTYANRRRRPSRLNATSDAIHDGGLLYTAQCAGCHGLDAVAGPLPDLRYATQDGARAIRGHRARRCALPLGMPSFKDLLSAEQVRAIQAYILSRAKADATPATR